MYSDRRLLKQWHERREGQVFRQITERYAPMVFATCVRVLGNPADAEDAAQECFETLIKAEKGPQTHLGAWLHRVAVNCSLARVRSEQRRRQRDHLYAAQQPADTKIQWDDLYDHVDAAIAELPEELRAAIIGHYLEGKTHAAVAREAGVSRRTATRRIGQGIQMLSRKLRERGVLAGASALAGFMKAQSASASVPAGLLTSLGKLAVAQAAATAASTSVVTGAAAGLGGTFIKILAAATVAGIILTGAWVAATRKESGSPSCPATPADAQPSSVQVAANAHPSPPETPRESRDIGDASLEPPVETANETASHEVNREAITGKVIDESGAPIPGAVVEASSLPWLSNFRAVDPNVLDKPRYCTCDAEGTFSFESPLPRDGLRVCARADGYQRKFVDVKASEYSGQGLVLTLKTGCIVSGRIVDIQGRPQAHIRVVGRTRECSQVSELTGDDGAFLLGNLSPGICRFGARQFVVAANRETTISYGEETDALLTIELRAGERRENVEITIAEILEYRVEGVVLSNTGDPIKGASVVGDYGGITVGLNPVQPGSTDEDGRFAIGFVPSHYSGGPATAVTVSCEAEGYEPLRVPGVPLGTRDLVLTLPPRQRGAIAGMVLRKSDRQPVGDAGVVLFQAETVRGGRVRDFAPTQQKSVSERTIAVDSEGKFVLDSVPAGVTTIQVYSPQHGFGVSGNIEVAADETREVEILLDEAAELHVALEITGSFAADTETRLEILPVSLLNGEDNERRQPEGVSLGGELEIGVPEPRASECIARTMTAFSGEKLPFKGEQPRECTYRVQPGEYMVYISARMSFAQFCARRVIAEAGRTTRVTFPIGGSARMEGAAPETPESHMWVLLLPGTTQLSQKELASISRADMGHTLSSAYGEAMIAVARNGEYRFEGVPAGTYTLLALQYQTHDLSLEGLATATVTVSKGETLGHDFD